MRKGIEEEVRRLLKEKPMKASELAEALGYKTKEVLPAVKSSGAFRIRELEDKGLVKYRDGKWHWVGE